MRPLLLVFALLQQRPTPPQVMSAVDRDHIGVLEEISFTVRVSSSSADPIQVILQPPPAFDLVSRTERSEVNLRGSGERITVVDFRLRANAAGEFRIGPVEVRQGSDIVHGDAVQVRVDPGASVVTTRLSARVAKLVERAPPPTAGENAAITLTLSSDTALVGEQVDVVTIAWFRRDLRQQLRRSPTVEAPRMEGVWNYPQPVPSGIASSRIIGGKWYDLFVLHQIVFPLTPGQLVVAPARLHYSVPLAFQFFSQEEHFDLRSAEARLRVGPLPDAGRPPGFAGAIGHNLTASLGVTPASARQGDAFTVTLTVKGEGNVALWPSAPIGWPPGFRAYPDATEERSATESGRLGGSKVFHYVLVPDSVGSAAVAPVAYSYFDPVLRSYQRSETGGLALVVAPRAEGAGSRALPPALMIGGSPSLAWSLRHGSAAVWWLLALLPPSFLLLRRIPRPRRRITPKTKTVDSLAGLELALDGIIAPLVPAAATHRDLISALRRAGIAEDDATSLLSLRERVRAARFGQGDLRSAAILAEAAPLLARLAGRRVRLGPRWRSVAAMALVWAFVPALESQGPSPEQLYQAGAVAAAAAGFAQRSQLDPAVPSNWYNLGASRYRLGQDEAALAAWTQAARLLPRDPSIRRALTLTPSADHGSARWLWVSPITPEELWLLAAAAWLIGWIGLLGSGRLRGRWLVLITAGGLLGAGAGTLDQWYHRPVAVSRGGEPLRVSPHELAPVVGDLAQGSAVRLVDHRSGWLFVEDAGGRRGWMLAESAVPVGPGN